MCSNERRPCQKCLGFSHKGTGGIDKDEMLGGFQVYSLCGSQSAPYGSALVFGASPQAGVCRGRMGVEHRAGKVSLKRRPLMGFVKRRTRKVSICARKPRGKGSGKSSTKVQGAGWRETKSGNVSARVMHGGGGVHCCQN